MNPKLHRPLMVIGLITISMIAIFVGPKGVSLYYQIRGGQRIEYTLRFEEGLQELECEPLSPVNEDARTEIENGIADLNRAIELNKNNAQAYYYLGKAYCLLGNVENAVEDYSRYTEIRPANPLGYIGLGFAYERLGDIQLAKEAWKSANLGIEDFLDVGLQIYGEGDYSSAKKWILRASDFADIQLDELPDDALNNNFIFESFLNTNAWRECKECNNVAGVFEAHDGILNISYKNVTDKRDGFAIVSYPNLPIYFYNELLLRIRADPGTLLTLELVIDGKRYRTIEYEEIAEEWGELSVPIEGIRLEEISISISELEPVLTPKRYGLHIDWISLN